MIFILSPQNPSLLAPSVTFRGAQSKLLYIVNDSAVLTVRFIHDLDLIDEKMRGKRSKAYKKLMSQVWEPIAGHDRLLTTLRSTGSFSGFVSLIKSSVGK